MENVPKCMKVFMLMFSAAVLFGCATTDRPLAMNDLSSLGPLKVIRFDTPEIERYTMGGAAKSLLFPTSWILYGMLGDIGRQTVAVLEGRALREKCLLSDYGQMVMNKFTEKAAKEIPAWPRMLIEDNPVQTDYEYKSGHILSFCVDYIRLNSFGRRKGLSTSTIAEMRTATGDLIWMKRYDYSQKKADRERELEELEANDCELLKEEIDYAAEKTAAEFTKDIKKSSQQ